MYMLHKFDVESQVTEILNDHPQIFRIAMAKEQSKSCFSIDKEGWNHLNTRSRPSFYNASTLATKLTENTNPVRGHEFVEMVFKCGCGCVRVWHKVPSIVIFSDDEQGVSNHLSLSIFRFHDHSQKVIGSLGCLNEFKLYPLILLKA